MSLGGLILFLIFAIPIGSVLMILHHIFVAIFPQYGQNNCDDD